MIRRNPTQVWSRVCSKACNTNTTTNGTGEVSNTGKVVNAYRCGKLGLIMMPALCERVATEKYTPTVCQYPPMLEGGMWKVSLVQVQKTCTAAI